MSCTKIKRGKVYIFNIKKLKTPLEEERMGSERDVENIRSTFEHINAVVVDPFIDITEENIELKMKEIKVENFTEYDYLAIVFSSHGGENSTAQTIDKQHIYLLRTFMVPLFKNPTLSKKLKWLITQTCRGGNDLSTEGPLGPEMQFNDPRYYLISYSTPEGCVSRRSQINGSIFIQSLCQELRAHYHDEDIFSILTRVSDSVRQISSQINVDQIPSNEDNFGEIFKFSFFNANAEE